LGLNHRRQLSATRVGDDGAVNVPAEATPVFVTAASPDDAELAATLLRRCGLQPVSVFEPYLDNDLATDIGARLSKAGSVVAVLSGPELSPGVIYEMGIGRGLGLPTLILFLVARDNDLPQLPGDLRGLHQVRWDPTTEPDANLLARLRALVTVRIAPPTRAVRTRPLAVTRTYSDETERRAAEVLTFVGAHVVTEGPGNRLRRPDLSAWFEDLPNWANPVVIEVKARDPSGRSHASAVEHLRTALHDLGLSIGVVLLPGDHPVEWASGQGTAVASIGVETLAQLGVEGTRYLLMRARNLVTHGA
jgi:hypothetical protein